MFLVSTSTTFLTYNQAVKHIRLVDKPMHDALHLVWLSSSYPNWQPFCPDWYYSSLWARAEKVLLSLIRRAMDPEHLLHDRLLFTPTKQQQELKSRHPFVPAALELLKDLDKSITL